MGAIGIGACRAIGGAGKNVTRGNSSRGARAKAACAERCTARQIARSSTNLTSALVGWTLTSTAVGST